MEQSGEMENLPGKSEMNNIVEFTFIMYMIQYITHFFYVFEDGRKLSDNSQRISDSKISRYPVGENERE